MKRSLLVCLLLSLFLFGMAQAEEILLPGQIQDTLSSAGISPSDVRSYLPHIGNGPYFSFVSAHTGRGNVLYGFRRNGSGLTQFLRSEKALSQKGTVELIDRTDEYYAGMQLGTAFSCVEDTNWPAETVWEWDGRQEQWVLRAYIAHDSDFSIQEMIRVTGDGLTYEGWQTNGQRHLYRGTVQTELRYFTYSVFPKTPAELDNKLTIAPDIPTGELSAQNIHFTGNRQFEVYSGPGEEYLRGGNGKASVSTNDWIQVFGREQDFILIQYAINKNHMRFGWIPDFALPYDARVDQLHFTPVEAYVNGDTSMTDDPLYSQSTLMEIPNGQRVSWLSTMGEWAYIEIDDWELARGFVPISRLRSGSGEKLNAPAPTQADPVQESVPTQSAPASQRWGEGDG